MILIILSTNVAHDCKARQPSVWAYFSSRIRFQSIAVCYSSGLVWSTPSSVVSIRRLGFKSRCCPIWLLNTFFFLFSHTFSDCEISSGKVLRSRCRKTGSSYWFHELLRTFHWHTAGVNYCEMLSFPINRSILMFKLTHSHICMSFY